MHSENNNNNVNAFTPYYNQILTQLFSPAHDALKQDKILVVDKLKKAQNRINDQKRNNSNDSSSSMMMTQKKKTNFFDDDGGNNNDDDDFDNDALLLEYGSLFGISSEEDLEARKEAKNKQITDLPQARLPVPEVRAILVEGETFLKVFGEKILPLLGENVKSKHDHSKNYYSVTSKEDSSSLVKSTTANSTSTTISNVFLKNLAKQINVSPSKFPTLFEHFAPQIKDILIGTTALACFVDCCGTNVLVASTNNNNTEENGTNNNNNNQQNSSSSSSANPITTLIGSVIRKSAQSQIFVNALEGRKISHTCPSTLVEMVLSKEFSQRLADAVLREFERGYRRMIQDEQKKIDEEAYYQNQGDDENNTNHEDAAASNAVGSGGGGDGNDNTTSMKNQKAKSYYSTDALQAIWSAFQYEQEKQQNSEAALKLSAQWILFVRMHIAPRLLSWASAVIDPLTFTHNNSSSQQGSSKNNSKNDAATAGKIDFYYHSQTQDENIWVTFNRLYEKILVPSLSAQVIDCDSVRTVLYRILLVFEGKLRRTNQMVGNVKKNTNTEDNHNMKMTNNNSNNAASSSSSLSNWASFSSGGSGNNFFGGGSVNNTNQTKTSSSATSSSSNLTELIESALSRRCGAAVFDAHFTTPDGYQIKVAEGSNNTNNNNAIQFYVKDQTQIFAKKGKLKNLATSFMRIQSIDDLVIFFSRK